MKTVTVVGTQWGDEGKGKVTDYLAQKADYVVRYQGGNNAGHTIKFDGKKFALHLVPSGIFKPACMNVMANGMVINPLALVEELDILSKAGVDTQNLKISEAAHVVFPYHEMIDAINEDLRGQNKVGTTFRGIGPAYADRANRIGLRMGDFIHKERLEKHLDTILPQVNAVLRFHDKPELISSELLSQMEVCIKRLKPHVENTGKSLYKAVNENKKVLFEGAQGTMLCLDHGTYPYVTSSSPTSASVPLNTGLPPQSIQEVVGVTKAYTTRVGSGFFATEFTDELADKIRIQGNEFGTTTNRPRRIGWLDLVVLNHSKRVNGLTSLAVMLLDVLSGVHPLKLCIGYTLDGQRINDIPGSIEDYSRVEPVYIELEGFNQDISSARHYHELPDNAKNYLQVIQKYTGLDIGMVSVGPSREQTIVLNEYFK